MAISLEGRFFAGLGLLDQGIEHMVLVADGAGLTLFTGSGRNGGLASFTLNATGGASVADTQVFHGDWTTDVSDSFALVSAPGGGLEAVIGSTQTGMISAYSVATNGQIGALSTYGGFSQGARPVAIVINPEDAAARGIRSGDLLRVFNARGACRARASVSPDILAGVVALPTGAWFGDPGGNIDPDGNPNVLTRDIGTSRLGQGCSAHTALVDVAKLEG